MKMKFFTKEKSRNIHLRDLLYDLINSTESSTKYPEISRECNFKYVAFYLDLGAKGIESADSTDKNTGI